MQIKYIFILAVTLLPIQTIGLDIGVMTVKISQALFLAYLLIAAWSCGLKFSNQQKLTLKFLWVTFVTFLISSALSDYPERSAVLAVAFFLCVLFFAATCIYLNSTKNAAQDLKAALYIAATLYSVYGVLQLALFFSGREANVNFEAWDLVPRVPYFSAENVHAAFLLLTIPLIYDDLIKRKERYSAIIGVSFLINCAGLAATGSRGAMLALLSVLVTQTASGIVNKNIRVGLIVGIGVAVGALVAVLWEILFIRFEGIFSGEDGTTNVRLSHYIEMLNVFEDSPSFGIGLGGSHSLGFQDIHNVLLQVLFEGGVVSFVPFAFALLLPAIAFFLKRKSGAFGYAYLAVVMQAMFEPSLYFYHLYLSLALVSFSCIGKYNSHAISVAHISESRN